MKIIEKKSMIIKDFDELQNLKKIYRKPSDIGFMELLKEAEIKKEDFPIKVIIKEERNENICK